MTPIFDDEPTIPVNPEPAADTGRPAEPEWMRDLPIDNDHVLGLQIYANPLLNAASELMALLISLSRLEHPMDAEQVRQILVDKLLQFRQQGLFLDYHPSVIDKSCFVLAAALDEVILHSVWGEKLSWENESLLSRVFNQRDGGEVFFDLLDQAKLQPGKLIDFLELQYVILCTGFLGRYRHPEIPGDRSAVSRYKAELYDLILHYRAEPELPPSADSSESRLVRPKRLFNLKTSWAIAIILMVSASVASWFAFHRQEDTLITEFDQLTTTPLPKLLDVHPAITSRHAKAPIASTVAKKPSTPPPKTSPPPGSTANWEVVLATFKQKANFDQLQQQIENAGYSTAMQRQKQYYLLVIPVSAGESRARELKQQVNAAFDLGAFARRKP